MSMLQVSKDKSWLDTCLKEACESIQRCLALLSGDATPEEVKSNLPKDMKTCLCIYEPSARLIKWFGKIPICKLLMPRFLFSSSSFLWAALLLLFSLTILSTLGKVHMSFFRCIFLILIVYHITQLKLTCVERKRNCLKF